MKRVTLILFVLWMFILLAVFPRIASADPISVADIIDSRTGCNPEPVILADDTYVTSKNTSIDILFTELLSNDYGSGVQVVNGAPPLYGTVTSILDGKRYTPQRDFVGTDVFTYTIEDDFGQTKTARVYVEVNE